MAAVLGTSAANMTTSTVDRTTLQSPSHARRIIRIVFIALLLDIFSFTIILPLLPRLIDYYREKEGYRTDTLLGQALVAVGHFRRWANASSVERNNTSLDTVLLGGALGSLFSILQCIASPIIGRASDRWGRRKTLLVTMVGNILSCLLWIFSGHFSIFLLARIVGGLSEGNVQLSTAIITDVTNQRTRSRGLAMVGIAFAIGFTVGPAMGAYFAKWHPYVTFSSLVDWGLNPYSGAALLALVLVVIETILVWCKLDETIHYRQRASSGITITNAYHIDAPTYAQRARHLTQLNRLHFLYLLLFSGMEYTLTFLTHDVHGFTPMQNGQLLGTVGIVSALVQGGYVRRSAYRIGEKRMVLQGIFACAFALFAIAQSVYTVQQYGKGNGLGWLWTAMLLFAFTSATVVNCLTALASMQCDGEMEILNSRPSTVTGKAVASDGVVPESSITMSSTVVPLARGVVLGRFRSMGQLGRAVGPLLACTVYWLYGPIACYVAGIVGMLGVAALIWLTAPERPRAAELKRD